MLSLTLTEESDAAAVGAPGDAEEKGVLPPATRDDVLLLVPELVTDAVRHAGAGAENPVAGSTSAQWLSCFGARAHRSSCDPAPSEWPDAPICWPTSDATWPRSI